MPHSQKNKPNLLFVESECFKNQPAIFKTPAPRFFRSLRKPVQLFQRNRGDIRTLVIVTGPKKQPDRLLRHYNHQPNKI
jgi:hypothetical protein